MEILDQVRSNKEEVPGYTGFAPHDSRLVDWRFLLPSQELGYVAMITPIQENLAESIIPFCEAYEIINPSSNHTSIGKANLLVLQNPSLSTFTKVKNRLMAGGLLYLEGSNPISRLMKRGNLSGGRESNLVFQSAARYIKALLDSGFLEIEVYWIWPDFKNNTKFIPLDGSAALNYVLNHNRSGFRSKLLSWFVNTAIKSGLILHLVPNFCVIAKRGEA